MKHKFLADGRVRLREVAVERFDSPMMSATLSTVVLRDLTPLERLDVEISADMSAIEMAARAAAFGIETWDGAEINVLQLMNRNYHRAVGSINAFVERHLMKIPTPQIDGDAVMSYQLTFPSGSVVSLKPLSVLEVMELEQAHAEGIRSDRRCALLSNAIANWNGEVMSAHDLLADRERHGEVVAVDRFLSQQFTFENSKEDDLPDDLLDERQEPSEPPPMVGIAS
jgi:hypothetical protein